MAPSPVPSSPRLPARARRDQLLDVTAEIVVEQGFQAASIQSVARAAGISRPIVYEHFGDLAGLLEALIKREMARAHKQVTATALENLSEGDPTELMLTSLRAYLSAVERNPNTWRLVLTPPSGAPESLRKSILQGQAAVLESLTQAVSPGFKPGDTATDPDLTARVLSAIADEYARLLLTDPERFSPERLLEHARWFLEQRRS
jgi:AcrR family transcriptional regulator